MARESVFRPVSARLPNGQTRQILARSYWDGERWCLYADTAFTVPARARAKGKSIRGYLTGGEDGVQEFRPYDESWHRELVMPYPTHCPKFNVTFEIVTPESAEHGDAEERGFDICGARLRDAFDRMGKTATENAGRWISNNEYGHGTRDYYESGREEVRSIHPPKNITPASYNRLLRLFGLKPRP